MSGNRAERRAASRAPASSLDARYGRSGERRALAPAVLGALVLLGGLLLVGQEAYLIIRFVVAILAVIAAVFTAQAGRWGLLPVPLVVAVLWNPVVPFDFSGQPFRLGHVAGAAALLVAGALARSRRPRTA